jgi:hypothetical protein
MFRQSKGKYIYVELRGRKNKNKNGEHVMSRVERSKNIYGKFELYI